MANKVKSSRAELSSCPYCKCRIKSTRLEHHLQDIHLIKELLTLHECAKKFSINEHKVRELAQEFGYTINASSDRIPITIAKKISDVFAFRSQPEKKRPKSSPTKARAKFVEGGLPSLGKKR